MSPQRPGVSRRRPPVLVPVHVMLVPRPSRSASAAATARAAPVWPPSGCSRLSAATSAACGSRRVRSANAKAGASHLPPGKRCSARANTTAVVYPFFACQHHCCGSRYLVQPSYLSSIPYAPHPSAEVWNILIESLQFLLRPRSSGRDGQQLHSYPSFITALRMSSRSQWTGYSQDVVAREATSQRQQVGAVATTNGCSPVRQDHRPSSADDRGWSDSSFVQVIPRQ
jgi:hypothetical protein